MTISSLIVYFAVNFIALVIVVLCMIGSIYWRSFSIRANDINYLISNTNDSTYKIDRVINVVNRNGELNKIYYGKVDNFNKKFYMVDFETRPINVNKG